MSNDWTIFVVVGSVVLLMLRFDRLRLCFQDYRSLCGGGIAREIKRRRS
jgi:hypothetical protein